MAKNLGLFLLLFVHFGCTSMKAKTPEELIKSSSVWEVIPPEKSFFNPGEEGQFFTGCLKGG